MDRSFIEQLRDYQKRVKDYLQFKETKPYKNLYNDERNTTVKFIIPLLNMLGWRHLSEDMEFEHTVRCKEIKNPKRVDIALYTKNSERPKILVEIKRIQDELGSGRQLLRYLHTKKIDYGVYTNGREIKLIHKSTPTQYVPEGLFTIKVEDFIKNKKVLSVLSKKSVECGKLDKLERTYHGKNFWNMIKKYQRYIPKYYLRLMHAEKVL